MLAFPIAAIAPLLIGAIYYSPYVAGPLWMRVNGFTEESLEGANMMRTLGLAYLFSLVVTYPVLLFSVHQLGIFGTLAMQEGFMVEGSAIEGVRQEFLASYGHLHRSFGHGLLHGGEMGLIVAGPILAINALFERRGWRYVAVHTGYWVLALGLMGGVLARFAEVY